MAQIVNLRPVTITREKNFKQSNRGEWVDDVKVFNSNGEYLGQVEYEIRNILEPMMKYHQWTMLLKVEFGHMNIIKYLL